MISHAHAVHHPLIMSDHTDIVQFFPGIISLSRHFYLLKIITLIDCLLKLHACMLQYLVHSWLALHHMIVARQCRWWLILGCRSDSNARYVGTRSYGTWSTCIATALPNRHEWFCTIIVNRYVIHFVKTWRRYVEASFAGWRYRRTTTATSRRSQKRRRKDLLQLSRLQVSV